MPKIFCQTQQVGGDESPHCEPPAPISEQSHQSLLVPFFFVEIARRQIHLVTRRLQRRSAESSPTLPTLAPRTCCRISTIWIERGCQSRSWREQYWETLRIEIRLNFRNVRCYIVRRLIVNRQNITSSGRPMNTWQTWLRRGLHRVKFKNKEKKRKEKKILGLKQIKVNKKTFETTFYFVGQEGLGNSELT